MARPPQLGTKSIQRIGRVVQEAEGAPQQNSHRRGRWPIAGGSNLKPYIITTTNCALDGFNLAVGTGDGVDIADDDGEFFVEGKPVDTVTGEVTPGGLGDADVDPVRIYCDRLTRGFLCFGMIVQATTVGGKRRARLGALLKSQGKLVSVDGDLITVNLWNDTPSLDDYYVDVEAVDGCSDGPNDADQIVFVQWEWQPGVNGGTARLRAYDWCCAT